jgi:hypothetical protein
VDDCPAGISTKINDRCLNESEKYCYERSSNKSSCIYGSNCDFRLKTCVLLDPLVKDCEKLGVVGCMNNYLVCKLDVENNNCAEKNELKSDCISIGDDYAECANSKSCDFFNGICNDGNEFNGDCKTQGFLGCESNPQYCTLINESNSCVRGPSCSKYTTNHECNEVSYCDFYPRTSSCDKSSYFTNNCAVLGEKECSRNPYHCTLVNASGGERQCINSGSCGNLKTLEDCIDAKGCDYFIINPPCRNRIKFDGVQTFCASLGYLECKESANCQYIDSNCLANLDLTVGGCSSITNQSHCIRISECDYFGQDTNGAVMCGDYVRDDQCSRKGMFVFFFFFF